MVYKKPRGTLDWYGNELQQMNEVVANLNNIAKNYGCSEIVPPTFESLDLFVKSVGETTDVVQKELYTFLDKKGRSMALRPEGTSSVIRAYVENKLYADRSGVTKLYYFLNLFRYERPQSGRLREFHQFGVEYLNVDSYLNDVECLLLAYNIIDFFKLSKYITLKINYLGNFQQRQDWMQELKTYFNQYKDKLTEDSIHRLDKNPLRILDDKIDGKKDFVINAPKLNKFLTNEDNQTFNEILNALTANNISYFIDDTLVRGLDYYTGVVFEFVYQSPVDSEQRFTVLGGGRYSNLIRQTGGPDQIGLGFGIGIERLLLALQETNYQFDSELKPDIVIGADCADTMTKYLPLISKLRNQNIYVELDLENYKKSKNAKFAIKHKARFFAFVTQENLQSQEITLENLQTNEHINIKLNQLNDFLRSTK